MTAPTLPLADRHALVTGGSRGIGLAIARALLDQGARVTITGRDSDALARARDTLAPSGDTRIAPCDITDGPGAAGAVARSVDAAGPVDILVNNAGQAASAPALRTDDALWDRMLEVNLTGTFRWTRLALPGMVESKWGRVVNVASTAGLRGYPYVAAYCAAKHGVVGLTRALALELATRGVTVNAVCPGYTETDLVADTIAGIVRKTGRSEAEARAELTRFNPQGRLVAPEEVAQAVAWLCLPESAAITGQAISVSGGETQ